MSTFHTTEYADVDDLPGEGNDSESQEMWEGLGWDDSIAACFDAALKNDAPAGAVDDADENPFLDDSKQPSTSKVLKTAISDPGPSKIHASLSRDSSTEEVPVALNSSQAYAVFPEYNSEEIAEADRVERDLIHDDSVEPEGPPATQAVSESSAANSSRTSRTSIASSSSLQDKCSGGRLGKRRAREDDELPPQYKYTRVNDDALHGPSGGLRTSKSDPGPSRPKENSSVGSQEAAPFGFAFIAHNTKAQQLFDELSLAWGVQYELARGASAGHWSWEDMTREKLQLLRGPNVESAPQVGAIMLPGKVRVNYTNKSLWEELDREQASIVENKSRGLGVEPDTWMGKPSWYGGQIQQIVRLHRTPSAPLAFTLCKMQMIRSHRFARYLGSRRVLQINIADTSGSSEPKSLLSQKLVLCGRVYITFAVKDGKVYAVEVDEDYHRKPREDEGDQHRCSLTDLVAWYNPTHLNADQPVTKWATRFDLGLSTSIPVILFAHEQVHIIDDEYAPHSRGLKVPTEKIYTDGCGFINAPALKIIQHALNLSSMPIAVQGRIFGSKGLWTLAPDPEHQLLAGETPQPQIWIRKSQQKIRLTVDHDSRELDTIHKAHFIFDLVAVSRVTAGAHLSRHTVVNLHHNGVPVHVFETLLKDGVQREMEPLSQTEGQYAMQRLYNAIDNAVHVSSTRLQHYAAGAQRVLGLSSRWENDRNDNISEETIDTAQSTTAHYYPGGKPASLAEGMLNLLKAGFTLDEDVLYEDLEIVKKGVLSNLLDKLRLPLRGAAEAFLVPDPSGKLRQGEIHFKSYSAFQDPPNGYDPHQITGSCLIYRNPARLPSDVLKVTAVVIPELSAYTDVIIVPNKGPCSLPSILAGGDVDGDTAICIWDHSVVEPFHNPPLHRPPENILNANFEAEGTILTVKELNEQLFAAADPSAVLRRHLLTGLTQSKVGIYSKYHDAAMYMFGYAHEKTLRIAHMFNIILDSRKSGHVVKSETFKEDSTRYNVKVPSFVNSDDLFIVSNAKDARRDPKLGRYILSQLASYAKGLRATHGLASDSVEVARRQSKRRSKITQDVHIFQEWNRLSHRPYFEDEILVVKAFVTKHFEDWKLMWQENQSEVIRSKAKQQERKAKANVRLRLLCSEFNAGPPADETSRLREHDVLHAAMAAYAYSLKPRFGFCVAFTQLALMKAKALGISPTIEPFADLMKIPSSAMRALPQHTEPTVWS